jgi:protein-tyrosine-phosphatase/DNA-binding transcriptional ArsR family regulator
MSADIALSQPPAFLKLLAHDLRWQMLGLLARSDYCGRELVRLLGQPQNLVSYHLRLLHDQSLVTERRSTADGRDIYYSLNLDTLHDLYTTAAVALHPALNFTATTTEETASHFSGKQPRILFLCTENSARSQMAEALLRHLSKGNIAAFSAGSKPTSVHPYAVQVMARIGIDISKQQAKHFDEFRGQTFDRVITVCDRVCESCPTFPGDPEHIHWSFLDPAAVDSSEQERYHAFEQVSLQLTTRIRYLLILLEREREKGKTDEQ